MDLVDRVLPSLAANLALDEALLLAAEAGGTEVLRLWEWRSLAVVVGAGGSVARDVDTVATTADKVPIFRRASGGGTVLLGPGCLIFSLVLRYDRASALRDINASYRWILDRLADALARLGPRPTMAGICDLTLDGRKFSGNAQQRKRTHLLHHGTLLYDFNTGLLGRYLRTPEREPGYRAGRDHSAFVCNLAVDAESLRSVLQTTWEADTPRETLPLDLVQQIEAKYEDPAWIYRR